jgi:hypothetical protein
LHPTTSNVSAVRNIIRMLSEALKMKHINRIMDGEVDDHRKSITIVINVV